MLFRLALIALALAGGLLGTAVSAVPGKKLRPFWTFPALLLLSGGLFLALVWKYTGLPGFDRTVELLFPDKLSKLTGAAIYLLICVFLGLLAGFLRAGGPAEYFRRVRGSAFHRRLALGGTVCALAAVLGGALLSGAPSPSPAVLSEVCCSNFSLRADPNGAYEDYIEIQNTGSKPLNLEGYYLSNKAKKRDLHRLPAIEVAPGACVLLWADGTGVSAAKGGTGTSLCFSLSPGDTVWFSAPSGTLIDHVTLPAQAENISMTHTAAGWVTAVGTPAAPNENAVPVRLPTLDAPKADHADGVYAEGFALTLSAQSGQEIRYTLDGSVPTLESPLYTGPIPISDRCGEPNQVVNRPNQTTHDETYPTEPVDKGTVVRAVAFAPDGSFSKPTTVVYFVGNFSAYGEILSVVADPDDLFGDEGILVTGAAYDAWDAGGRSGEKPVPNFLKKGREWERPAEMTLLGADGTPVLSQACGMRVQGASTRDHIFKRFSLYARKIYSGSSTFDVPLFSGTQRSHSVLTRSENTDVFVQQLAADRDLSIQDARPVQVFLNGEFYRTAYLREKYDENYFLAHYGVKPEDLVIIDGDVLDNGLPSDLAEYTAFFEWLKASDPADPATWETICAQMDVQSFADFMALCMYSNNSDWGIHKNYRVWRSKAEGGTGMNDGRWRWLCYDMDSVNWYSKRFETDLAEHDTFQLIERSGDFVPFVEMPIFKQMLQSGEFRQRFALAYLDLMNVNFNYDHALPLLEKWDLTEDFFWPEFLQLRPKWALMHLQNNLHLTGEACEVRIRVSDPAGGTVMINTTPLDLSGGIWHGTYVTDYPVTLRVSSAAGWRFIGWADGSAETTRVLALSPGENVVTALFEREGG